MDSPPKIESATTPAILIRLRIVAMLSLTCSGCLVERTVTDESGELIYQQPELVLPAEDERQIEREVGDKEQELGW